MVKKDVKKNFPLSFCIREALEAGFEDTQSITNYVQEKFKIDLSNYKQYIYSIKSQYKKDRTNSPPVEVEEKEIHHEKSVNLSAVKEVKELLNKYSAKEVLEIIEVLK